MTARGEGEVELMERGGGMAVGRGGGEATCLLSTSALYCLVFAFVRSNWYCVCVFVCVVCMCMCVCVQACLSLSLSLSLSEDWEASMFACACMCMCVCKCVLTYPGGGKASESFTYKCDV